MQVETRQDDASKMQIHLVLGWQTHPCVLMKNREVYLQFFGVFLLGGLSETWPNLAEASTLSGCWVSAAPPASARLA